MDHVELLKEKLLLACKIFQSQKLFDGFGHVTACAAEDRILSAPKMPPGKVSMRDFIILNMEGEKLEGFGEPNGETPMHTSIYRARPEVKCILHSAVQRSKFHVQGKTNSVDTSTFRQFPKRRNV